MDFFSIFLVGGRNAKKTSIKINILDFRIERDIERDPKLSLCVRVMDRIQFSGIFHLRSFTKKVLQNSLTPEFGVSYFHAIHKVQQTIDISVEYFL